jgi:ferredoxin-type protein NapH
MTKASSMGILTGNLKLSFFLSFGLIILGAFIYFYGTYANMPPGIKNNHIFMDAMTSKGWLGVALGTFMIAFYVFLYFFPEYLTNWVLLVDPISYALNGGPASHWFLYGFLYTLAVFVMGIRMILKYRHNTYQIMRTISVIFFQTALAFIIPEILIALNKPGNDFKNIWPLDYDFFYGYNLESLMQSGAFGWFMLCWGIALIIIAVPVITYFYGKRWYCSWVCGCGGLAETLGDPFRQLSDKSLKAWKIERWMIHAVLVFAVINTIGVLYTFFTESYSFFRNRHRNHQIQLWLSDQLDVCGCGWHRLLPITGKSCLVSVWLPTGRLPGFGAKIQIKV